MDIYTHPVYDKKVLTGYKFLIDVLEYHVSLYFSHIHFYLHIILGYINEHLLKIGVLCKRVIVITSTVMTIVRYSLATTLERLVLCITGVNMSLRLFEY